MITPFIRRLNTKQVSTNVGTKQALYTVPVGKSCIVTHVVIRNVSATLAGIGDDLVFGFDAGAIDWKGFFDNVPLATLTGPTLYLQASPGSTVVKIGAAGNVFGCIFKDASKTATAQIDVFGYVYT